MSPLLTSRVGICLQKSLAHPSWSTRSTAALGLLAGQIPSEPVIIRKEAVGWASGAEVNSLGGKEGGAVVQCEEPKTSFI